jgi:hypothetical protein
MRILSILISGVIFLTLSGCNGDPPPGNPPPAVFADYYAGELVLLEKARLQAGVDTIPGASLDSLQQRYGFTRHQRDSLLAYCQASLPRWESFLRDVLTRLDEREKAAKESGGAAATGAEGGKRPSGKSAVDADTGRRKHRP